MIFKQRLIDQIQAGKKTMTRRPVKPGKPCTYVAGRPRKVQPGRGERGLFPIFIDSIRRERLGDISFEDARREGFKTRDDFFAYWAGLYGSVDYDLEVWVISFRVQHELAPRFLAKVSGYTDKRHLAIDDVEALDEFALERMSREARKRFDAEHPRPKPVQPVPRSLLDDVEEALRRELRLKHEGWEAEDVSRAAPHQGTPGDVRRRRREMGLRGTDGMPQIPEQERQRLLLTMVLEERSVRDIARVMDCSVGKAHTLIHQHQEDLAA